MLTPVNTAARVDVIHNRCKPLLLASAISCAILGSNWVQAQQAPAATSQTQSYDIPAQPLDAALVAWSQRSGVQLFADAELTNGLRSSAVEGLHLPSEALRKLLVGTGLVGLFTEGEKVILDKSQNQESLIELEATSISGRTQDAIDRDVGSYTSSTIGLMKGVTSIKEIPQTVSVITRQRMDDQKLTNVRQSIEQSPGIYTSSFGTVLASKDTSASFFSRGYKISSYMVDGVSSSAVSTFSGGYKTNDALSGSSAIYDRIEILRGAAGLLVGEGAPGGTVNLVRKRPSYEFKQQYEFGAGSWDNYRGLVDVSGPVTTDGKLRGRIVTEYQSQDRFWDTTDSESPLLYGILEFDSSRYSSITAGFRYEKYSLNAPRNGWYHNISFSPSRAFLPNPVWGYSDTIEKEVFADFSNQLNDRWEVLFAGRYAVLKNDTLMPYTYAGGASSTYRLGVWDYETSTLSGDINLNGEFDLLGSEHKLMFGLNSSEQEAKGRSVWVTNYSAQNSLPYDYLEFDPKNSWLKDELVNGYIKALKASPRYESITKSHGLYGKLDYKIAAPLSLVVGGRVSWYDYEYNNEDGLYVPESSGHVGGELTPYFGFVLELSPDWSTYVSYSDIFQPQLGYYKRDGGSVDSLLGKNYEFGIKGGLYGGELSTAFAIYQVDLENVITSEDPPYDDSCPGNPVGDGCVKTIGKQRTRGFDAEVSGEIYSGWQASIGYTYTHSEVLKSSSGTEGDDVVTEQGYGMPKHMAKIYTTYDFSGNYSGWTLGGGVSVQSRQYQNGKKVQGGYSVWNAMARYDFNDNVDVSLNVNNLFDKIYWSNGTAHAKLYYGEPVSYIFTLSAKY